MIKKLHRTLGICAMVFWLAQVVTGIAIEVIWLYEGVRYYQAGGAPSAAMLGQRLEGVIAEGAKNPSLWASGTIPGQMKIFYQDRAGAARVRRLDNRGNTLYDMSATSMTNHEGMLRALSDFHESLLWGQTGNWIVALSGALLCTNLALGLRLALRGRSKLWRDLFVLPRGSSAVRWYQFHKAAGLWIAIPALVVAVTGTTLAVCKGAPEAAAATRMTPIADERPIGASDYRDRQVPTTVRRAVDMALEHHPGSSVSAISLPAEPRGWYQVLLRTPDEMPRFWGTTRVYVSGVGAQELNASLRQPVMSQVAEAVYPFHTGQVGRLAGRISVLCVAIALIMAFMLGLLLWRTRHRART